MKIDIIFNDPTQYSTGRIWDDGKTDIDKVEESIDMSEYGVLDEMKSVQRALKANIQLKSYPLHWTYRN
jgi:hypothetical protein